MLNVAVVGMGWWGKIIVPLLKTSSKINVTKVVEVNPASITDFARQHQVEVVVAPGVRLVIEAGAEPPADPASLEQAIGAALAAWQQYVAQGSRPAGEGGS